MFLDILYKQSFRIYTFQYWNLHRDKEKEKLSGTIYQCFIYKY